MPGRNASPPGPISPSCRSSVLPFAGSSTASAPACAPSVITSAYSRPSGPNVMLTGWPGSRPMCASVKPSGTAMRSRKPSISSSQGKSPQLHPAVGCRGASTVASTSGCSASGGTGVSVRTPGVGVGVLVGVRVGVGVNVSVGVKVSVGVRVAVGEGVTEGVSVGVTVGVFVSGMPPPAIRVGVRLPAVMGVRRATPSPSPERLQASAARASSTSTHSRRAVRAGAEWVSVDCCSNKSPLTSL